MLKLKKNLSAGIFSCAMGIGYRFLIPIGIKKKLTIVTNAVGPDYMPRLVSAVLFILGLILIFQSLVLKKEEELIIDFKQEKTVFLYLAVLLGLIISIPRAGFLASSLVAAILFFLVLGEKNKIFYGIILSICVLIYLLFRFALGIPLP